MLTSISALIGVDMAISIKIFNRLIDDSLPTRHVLIVN